MSESKSLLARLLAKENITVQYGNYKTAYFDVQNRILGLPLWRDDDKDLHDMLVGHEVGHALFTPAEGWQSIQVGTPDDRVPAGYLNVVEDIRIERMIQEKYPGLARSFRGGYTYLYNEDFFGIANRDVNEMKLVDRINVKAKLRDLVDVEYSDEEMPIVNQAFSANTWDEVVEAARALYEWTKSLTENDDQSTETVFEPSDETSTDFGDFEGEVETDEDSEESLEQDFESENGSDDSDRESEGEDTSEADSEESVEESNEEEVGQVAPPKSIGDDIDEVETLEVAKRKADELLETDENGEVPIVFNGLTREQIKSRIVPFEVVKQSRLDRVNKIVEEIGSKYNDEDLPHCDEYWYNNMMAKIDPVEEYKKFVAETKRVVNVMAKEFETRKAAYQYSRASTSRSGSLDLEKLHAYKTSDDIFQRVTRLADAKSHGMVMLIDNSMSMHGTIGGVLTQVLSLAMFCKRVNIPFDVYSFTNGAASLEELDCDTVVERKSMPPESINHYNFRLSHYLSSSFSKRDYDIAFRQIFNLSQRARGSSGEFDVMAATPLDEILTGMHIILKDFKSKHNAQKTIFTVLTDGDSNRIALNNKYLMDSYDHRRGLCTLRMKMSESRNVVKMPKRNHTTAILKALKNEVPGLTNLGYFIALNSSDFSNNVRRAVGQDGLQNARKIANANKFVSYDNVLGYDRYFIVRGENSSNLEARDDEFEISENAKRGEITRAFKKYAKSKKGNRIFATQFAEIVS